ncbi:MAG: hypothetical protein AAF354_10730 [Pseudomonadota bacterium]
MECERQTVDFSALQSFTPQNCCAIDQCLLLGSCNAALGLSAKVGIGLEVLLMSSPESIVKEDHFRLISTEQSESVDPMAKSNLEELSSIAII